ncbi:hypothetical protein ElyMa_002336300 [Elysia marginata]|uniref:Phosphatidic acid phosphatase type 2/haloperoxidase domain-containing protein n=1 Tax=Elysia marginata TaxID=1093978 RepID=A0AAV4G8B9_9GAST|nr:hypothetical protein ElyMa_002336300 [Elysia marginata]
MSSKATWLCRRFFSSVHSPIDLAGAVLAVDLAVTPHAELRPAALMPLSLSRRLAGKAGSDIQSPDLVRGSVAGQWTNVNSRLQSYHHPPLSGNSQYSWYGCTESVVCDGERHSVESG